ncbi:MAG: M1 family metallopeptidase [Candidatus Marinimicrobia bacterium]|nr:M1 family metallopeptidase [Candidatus Neomarinimicrobiota bacterium]
MRRKSIQIILFLSFLNMPLIADYWQQYVEYSMDIYLDSEEKILNANSDLLYVNHSPDTLNHILMHLYPNAFNAGTIAEQVWRAAGQSFDLEKGWTGIRIEKAVSDSANLSFLIRDDTILEIELERLLFPGDTLVFSLDWLSIIHPHIDRGGWEDKQFDFAQWYPKFVVYDELGWHDDPFGDWGEFYGEFGKYTVNVDVPAGQIVAATGFVIDGDPGWESVRVDTSRAWEDWVDEFTEQRDASLAALDSTERRVVSFLAEDVHDFAWSCSQDYVYEHGSWNGIDVHVLFDPEEGEDWTINEVKWGQNSLEWLSEKFGAYPWPQITIIQALLSGGMEYPMLVMDSYDSESLVLHEIGHNWFFGIFGNDELDDAWLDEGFTTFQTSWYLEDHYPNNDYYLSREYITQFEYDNLPLQSLREADLKKTIQYMLSPANEPIARHSFDFQAYNSYNYNAYEKPALMLHTLKKYLGEERFLAGMKLYYSRWALKHVNEERFIQVMEDVCGEELDWFFDQWLHTSHWVDYKLSDWSIEKIDQDHFITQINVENKGGMFAPITATVYGEAGEMASASLKEFRYRDSGTIMVESDFHPARVFIDREDVFLDVDRRDNDSNGKWSLRYDYKGWDDYPDDRNLYLWKPMFGYSDSSGLGVGINIKRVYRYPGDYIQLSLDENFGSGNLDGSLAFKYTQIGLPFKGTWAGMAQVWRSIVFGSLAYEINWAQKFWRNPIHFLTLKIETTDAANADISPVDQTGFTRLGVTYELQDDLFSGDYGFNGTIYTSPGQLGGYGFDFTQISLMSNWNRSFSYFRLNNRSNFLANSKGTPTLIKSRVASTDLRSVYLDRGASSLYRIEDVEMIGSHYYLRGGGRMRAYTDSLDQPMNFIWSNNLDLTFRTVPYLPKSMDIGIFFDVGQLSDDAKNWDNVGDVGFAINYRPKWERNSWISTWFRPFHMKFELGILRVEGAEWVSTMNSNQWLFSISN